MTRNFDMQNGVKLKKAFLEVIVEAERLRCCESVFAKA